MAFSNLLKPGVDLPVAEQLRFLPVATSALSCMCSSDETNDRYIYYLNGSVFYRYDRLANCYQLLQSPQTAPVTTIAMRYTVLGGYRGNILGAGANTAIIPGLGQNTLVGQKIRISAGTGIGQERTITATTDNIVKDHGVATAAAVTSIADNTKKWQINEWVGFQVRLVFGAGQSQIRKVLYNDATTLYFQDAYYQQLEAWNNTAFNIVSPYAAPGIVAGAQTHYTIEQTEITVNAAWDVQPDESSSFVLLSGGIWLISSAAAAPWMTVQYYCQMSDTWTTKTSLGGHLLAAFGTDFSMERTGEIGGVFVSGTATSGTNRTLTDTSKTMEVDRYCNHQVRITAGTGAGQRRRIVANGTNYFETEKNWDINPDATSVYSIYGNTEEITLCGNGASAMYKLNAEIDAWYQGQLVDSGIARNASVSYKGQEAFAISAGTRNTGGITAVNPTPTAGGTGYAVGDVCNVTTGGTLGKVRVTSVSAGVVTGVELYACGLTYTTGTAKATAAILGVGTGLTIEITAIGVIGRLTFSTNHNICKGDQVTLTGITESLWNATYTALAVDSIAIVEIIITATATASSLAQTTTVLVDSTKNWTVNEHIGKLVSINTAGISPTTQIRRITANTPTTITLQSAITAAVTGVSRYTLYNPEAFGRDVQYKVTEKSNTGRATGGSATTLVDDTKQWNSNQWAGYKIRIVAGLGVGSEFAITSNTTTTLTYTAPGFTPNSTTKYLIMDTFGLATSGSTTTLADTTKNWAVNQWAGKRCKLTSGTGAGQEFTIVSNTATTLTFVAITTGPSTDTTYTILGMPPRSTGITINWLFGCSDASVRGKFMALPRGGATNVVDRYDIVKDIVEYALVIIPQSEILTTGTMYTYDGGDYLYFQIAGTQRIERCNMLTGRIDCVGMLPYPHSTAIIGNRMEYIEIEPKTQEVPGYAYIYIALHTRAEFFRLPIYW